MKKKILLCISFLTIFLALLIFSVSPSVFLPTFMSKEIYTQIYSQPQHLVTGGVFSSNPAVRCLCYGKVKTSTPNYAADPSSYDYCTGWVDKNSCELETKDGWSRTAYEAQEIQKQKEQEVHEFIRENNIPNFINYAAFSKT